MPILSLILRDLRHHKTRSALTIGAVAIAGSLVVAMTSGFASLNAAAHQVLGMFYGPVDIVVEPREELGDQFGEEFVGALRGDERVFSLRAQLTGRALLLNERGEGVASRPAQLIGIHPADLAASPRHPLRQGQWFAEDAGDVAVIDESIGRRRNVQIGGTIRLAMPDGPHELTVVGMSARPGILRMEAPTIYLPLSTLQAILGRPNQVSTIEIDLKPGHDVATYAAELERLQIPGAPPHRVKTVATQQQKLDRSFEGLELLSYLGGTVSMIAAVFIIFSTLSMGVSERSRVLAMLRAIGAERSQVFRLVIGEGLLLAMAGSLLGVALGYVWVKLLVRGESLFTAGVVLSRGGVIYGVAGAMTAALLASILPAYAASRVSALEAMAVVARQRGAYSALIWAAAGLGLLMIDSLIIYAGAMDRELRIALHLYVGLPCLMLGLLAIAPLVVQAVDAILGPAVATALGLKAALLRQQLGGALWRSAGTAAALMVGLVVLILIRTHGNNMIRTWQLPDRFPDLLMFSLASIDREGVKVIEQIEGIDPGRVLPVALVSPGVDSSIFSVAGIITAPSSTMMFGLDIDRAFGATDSEGGPMVELEFLEGDPPAAARLLKEGRYLLVSEEFRKLKGFGVGDTLAIETTRHGKVDYTIAGVVRSPGVDLIVRLFNIAGEFEQWTSAAVATDIANVERDFGVGRFHMLAANLSPSADRAATEEHVKAELLKRGFFSTGSAAIKGMIDMGLGHVLNLSSAVALMAILVASVGVTNTIMASVRSRRWQFGVLRAVGLTRWALLRLVIAEALLIALVAMVLGIGGGLLLSFNANGSAGLVIGVSPQFAISPRPLWIGALITLGVSLAAGIWPALRVATTDTLKLLQAGRASA